MGRRLRVFISSTMMDLANERDLVCRRLREFNFEPVNAEGWLPSGTGTWDEIASKIAGSDVLLLILGERYGWIPMNGPQSGLGLSVTHLEYREANQRGLPTLPFLKKLRYKPGRRTSDEKKRDLFREEVRHWDKGRLVAEFDLAVDLAEKAGHSLVGLLTNDFLRRKIRGRASLAESEFRLYESHYRPIVAESQVEVPAQLVAAVARREAVLLAGAGISMSAGLPSAAAFAEHLAQVLYRNDPEYGVSPAGAAFAAIASDVEASTSRAFLLKETSKLLDPPQGLEPTAAHIEAVRIFDLIVTTNWDSLFEKAAIVSGKPLAVIANEIKDALPCRALIKLHGSLESPESLLLTESDVLRMDANRARLWNATRELLRHRTLVVVGTSLRDPSIIRLLEETRPRSSGYFVVPRFLAATASRLRRWNLQCIAADADSFFKSLADTI
ncbi:MAG: DUF4062 domain-containing protein [Desulfomonile tiedjei]|uniref:DUF4062 domain-containing protein n=1 Tax=Desulfomonile tiedjei TaxID=2358 RepID=A0A9D6V805_9BACT|nr:DUF4062 domain-containing protein [Desulfomonile tiedjei]